MTGPHIPAGGAIDLDAFRRTGAGKAEVEAKKYEWLKEQGLICDCGERIRDQGVQLLGAADKLMLVPTPQGPQPLLPALMILFHSRECPNLVELLKQGRGPGDTKFIALRDLGPVEWLDEVEEGAA